MYKTMKDVYGQKIQAIEILGGAVRQIYSEIKGQFFITLEFYKVIDGKDVIIESYTNQAEKEIFIADYNKQLVLAEQHKQMITAELAKIEKPIIVEEVKP